jgi:pyruvate dehydrogenase E1 component beta subunit
MRGLMAAAIRDDDPVLVFSDGMLWGVRGPVGEGDYTLPLGVADVKRAGSDVTIVAVGAAVGLALTIAEKCEEDGISVEVLDPRSLVPLDRDTITASVAKTGRLVVIDPGPRTCGFAGEVIATAAECGVLRAPPIRITGADVPSPFSPPLEQHVLPDAARLADAVRRSVNGEHLTRRVPPRLDRAHAG